MKKLKYKLDKNGVGKWYIWVDQKPEGLRRGHVGWRPIKTEIARKLLEEGKAEDIDERY